MHPNVDLIQKGFEAFAKGDLAALTELMSPDVVWVAESGGVIGGRIEGRDNVFANFARIPAETGGSFRQEVVSIYADDRVAVATTKVTATRRGKSLDAPGAIVFQIKDGIVTAVRVLPEEPDLNQDFWAE